MRQRRRGLVRLRRWRTSAHALLPFVLAAAWVLAGSAVPATAEEQFTITVPDQPPSPSYQTQLEPAPVIRLDEVPPPEVLTIAPEAPWQTRDEPRGGEAMQGETTAGETMAGETTNAESASPSAPSSGVQVAGADAARWVAGPINALGVDIFLESLASAPDQTVLISPYGLAVALTMTAQGAGEATRSAFHDTLRLGHRDSSDAAAAHRGLRQSLTQEGTDAGLVLATALWAREGTVFNPAYLAVQRDDFGAEIHAGRFEDPATVGRINAWVTEATDGMIPRILESVPSNTVLVLISALHFQGRWAVRFDADATERRDFDLPSGDIRTVAMMMRRGDPIAYHEGDAGGGFQAVELPYGDGTYRMVAVLPGAGFSLDAWLTGEPGEDLRSWIDPRRFVARPGVLGIPRMDLAFEAELNDALSELGLGVAFVHGEADFSAMTEDEVAIDSVIHNTVLRVDEESTQAAAATSVIMTTRAVPLDPVRPFEMVLDRPFFVVIRHAESGTIVFLGYVADPGSA